MLLGWHKEEIILIFLFYTLSDAFGHFIHDAYALIVKRLVTVNCQRAKWQRCQCKDFLMTLCLSYKIRSQTVNTSIYLLLTT